MNINAAAGRQRDRALPCSIVTMALQGPMITVSHTFPELALFELYRLLQSDETYRSAEFITALKVLRDGLK